MRRMNTFQSIGVTGAIALSLLAGCQEAEQTPPVTSQASVPASASTAEAVSVVGTWKGTYTSVADNGYLYESGMSVEIMQKGPDLIGKWHLAENGSRWENPLKPVSGGIVSVSSRGEQPFALGNDGTVQTLSAQYRSSWNGEPTSITVKLKKVK